MDLDLREVLAPQGHVRAGILLGFSQDIPRDRYGPEEQKLVADAVTETNVPAIRAYLATRSTRAQLANVRIPTFLLQGRRDFAFDVDQALAAYRLLKGPKRLYLGDFGHSPAKTPPLELTYLKYASAPLPTEPYAAAGPLIGIVAPSVISFAVTPGVAAGALSASAAAAMWAITVTRVWATPTA